MNFSEAMAKIYLPTSCIIPTDDEGYWNFNIGFIKNDGHEDETQLDVKPHQFDYVQKKCPELNALWDNFCKENKFKKNSITYITLDNLN